MVARFTLLLALCLAGCGTLVEGNEQILQVITNPDGARCEIRRGGDVIAEIAATPMTVAVPRHARALEVTCARAPYPAATRVVHSAGPIGSPGHAAGGGWPGKVLDTVTLRSVRYPSLVVLDLAPRAARERPLPLGY